MRMVWIAFTMAVATLSVLAHDSSSTKLTLHRAFPPNQSIHLKTVIARDRARHAHIVGDFHLLGDISVSGMYYTKVSVGTPPQEFNVMIDTGGDLTWISCANCTRCPQDTSLDIKLKHFNVSKSSTGVPMSCKDYSKCSGVCSYQISYVGGSQNSGYMVSDVLSLHPVNKSSSSHSRAPIHFGCSTNRVDFVPDGAYVDGVFGFDQGDDSVVQQLSAQGITPKVFSHCLEGGDRAGGVLVMGEALHPKMVYTPLVRSQYYYTIKLEGLAINGKPLPVSSAVFSKKSSKGNIDVDSGTTLSYLDDEIYEPLMDAISDIISHKVKSYTESTNGWLCYLMTSRETTLFPQITFNFAGGASMVVRPEDYLAKKLIGEGSYEMCMGFQKVEEELVLRDKIVVYDLFRQRLGWSSTFNCSLHMDVNTVYGFTNDGQCCSSRHDLLVFFVLLLLVVLV